MLLTKEIGTVGSIAPEVLFGGLDVPYDGAKADIWSSGKSMDLLGW
jgi:serine/threonine protein kinase